MWVRLRLVEAGLLVAAGLIRSAAADGPPSPKPALAPLRSVQGLSAPVCCAAFSAGGKFLAAGTSDGAQRVWDVAGFEEIATLPPRPQAGKVPGPGWGGGVTCLAFANPGTLAAAESSATIGLWEFATAKEVRKATGKRRVFCIAVARNGRLVALTAGERGLELLELGAGAEAGAGIALDGPGCGVQCAAYSPAGKVIAADADDRVWIGEATPGRALIGFPLGLGVVSVACSPDGKSLAAGHVGGPITLWNGDSPRPRRILAGHAASVAALAFSPDGKTLASAAADGTIQLWDIATGCGFSCVAAHCRRIECLAFSDDGRLLASGGEDRRVRLWSVRRMEPLDAATAQAGGDPPRPPQPQPGETTAVAGIKRLGGRWLAAGSKCSWAPDGTRLVFEDAGGLTIFDLHRAVAAPLVKPGRNPAWSPGEGRQIAYVVGEGTAAEIRLIKPAGSLARKLTSGNCPAWSADGRSLFFYSPSDAKLRSIRVDAKDGRAADLFPAACSDCATMRADAARVAYCSGSQIIVADPKSGAPLHTWPVFGAESKCQLQWSPDGKQLGIGVAGGDCAAGLWLLDVERGRALHVVAGPATAPAWSADAARLAFDLRLPNASEIWTIESHRLGGLRPLAPATPRCSVPEAAAQLLGVLHEPQGELHFVDLQRYANRKLSEAAGRVAGNDLGELPRGEQVFAGVRFHIAEGAVQLGSSRLPDFVQSATGIPLHARAVRLYLLHAVQWGGSSFGISDGTTVGEFRVHYADGSACTLPIVYGEDVRDWWCNDRGKPVTRAQVAWAGRNAANRQGEIYLRLYLSVWENPHPEREIAAIDYSSRATPAAPFCVAITAEAPALAVTQN
jgi:WD40 repeat protein